MQTAHRFTTWGGAAGLAALAVVISVAGHVFAGGHTPGLVNALLLWVLAVPLARRLPRSPLRTGPTVTYLTAMQVLAHVLSSLHLPTALPVITGSNHAAHHAPAGHVDVSAHEAHVAHAASSWTTPWNSDLTMLLAHLGAAAVLALVLARGDQLLAAVGSLILRRPVHFTPFRPPVVKARIALRDIPLPVVEYIASPRAPRGPPVIAA